MIQALQDIQAAAGAVFESVAGKSVPISFGNDALALQAASEGVAVCDRSHWGRIQVSDDDRIRYLHNQSTNDFYQLKPKEGCDTVFVTSTARTIDLATAYVLEDSVLLIVSPQRQEKLVNWLDRYIFGADRVKIKDITDETAAFSLIGPDSHRLVEQLGGDELFGKPHASHQVSKLLDVEVRIAVGSGLASPGYTLIVDAVHAATLWQHLVEQLAVPLGDRLWEQLRIAQGRPAPDHELTEDYNPLEAGLGQTLSFAKGCYIGQETIARLNTYQGVKQQLWGVRLSGVVEPGSAITLGEDKVGKLTSVTETPQGVLGLAYIRTKAGGAGLKVQIGEQEGEIIDLPFATRI
ncbi:MAG: folate-binding protein [Leptolyngbyaceae bacterium]|nr:folate-binding protein [Leptolyngbyaceae bacterium]